jgi:predicted nucleic acid-binding protein
MHAAGRAAARELVAEYESEHRPLPAASRQRAREFLAEAGLLDDAAAGRTAGIACAASGTADVVDAIVIATAVRHQAAVVTSDPGDLTRLATAIGVKIRLFPA